MGRTAFHLKDLASKDFLSRDDGFFNFNVGFNLHRSSLTEAVYLFGFDFSSSLLFD
jgi:hypothetical protein